MSAPRFLHERQIKQGKVWGIPRDASGLDLSEQELMEAALSEVAS